ncbi:MAG: lysophospholipid acyltransferase family protein [Pikeienuella sp.]
MNWFRVTAFNLLFYPFTIWVAFVAWVLTYVSTEVALRNWLHWWSWRVFGLLRFVLNSKVIVEGKENLPAGAYVLAPKHMSELDVCFVLGHHRNVNAVAMAELAELPFLGAILKKMRLICVPVDSGPQGMTQVLREGAKISADRGQPIVIFPEGELMAIGARERYKSGVFHAYEAAGLPVVPVAQSLGVIWPRRHWRKFPNHIAGARYLPPIQPGLDKETFLTILEERIETESMAMIRSHAKGAELLAAEDRYARKAANED